MKGNEKYLTLTPVKAIRAYCLDCCCGSSNEVDLCPRDGEHGTLCALWKYRKGHNPNITAREISEERREALHRQIRNMRENRIRDDATTVSDASVGESEESIPPEEAD